jgi:isopenicillin-N N-acyltransferase-like protein
MTKNATVNVGWPLVEVSGTSYEMGYQHGAQASELVQKYLIWIDRMTGKARDELCGNAMAFLPLVENLSPNLVEEIRGLADGAGISFEEAVLCQARGEAARASDEACTAFALTGRATLNGVTLAGQNQDLAPEYADFAILLHAKPTDGRPRALLFTFAGQLGYSGMNEYGVAHFANALYDCPWQMGLPHYPIKRVTLEQKNLVDISRLLKAHPTCSAGNMVICTGEGEIADYEIRPEGAVEYRSDDPDCIIHANHYESATYVGHETNSLADSCPRADRMRELVGAAYGNISVDTMKAFLADHVGDPAAICRHGAESMISVSGYIADATNRVLHVRRGHGCTGSWSEYEV